MPDLTSTAPAPAASDPASPGKAAVSPEVTPVQEVPWWRCGVLLALTVVTLLSYWFNPPLYVPAEAGVIFKASTEPGKKDEPFLPTQVGDYHGLKGAMSSQELGGLPRDTGFARREYFNSTGDDILATIVLAGAGQNSIHRPEACLEGQGWTVYGHEDIPIKLLSGREMLVHNLLLQRDERTADGGVRIQHRLYMYWFVGDHVTTPWHTTRVWLGSWDRVMHNRAHRWAFVIATSAVGADMRPDGKSLDETRTMLANFVRDSVPYFQKSEMTGPPPTE